MEETSLLNCGATDGISWPRKKISGRCHVKTNKELAYATRLWPPLLDAISSHALLLSAWGLQFNFGAQTSLPNLLTKVCATQICGHGFVARSEKKICLQIHYLCPMCAGQLYLQSHCRRQIIQVIDNTSAMWLINTSTRKLEFFASPPDRYAILSHTWVDRQEISFQDFLRLQAAHPDPNDEAASHRARSGYDKILRCCSLAEEKGLSYAWVDTCCIDKTSSAELSESINSMFAWYKCATVCFAYLQDVHSTSDTKTKDCEPSRWYSRGWTLQELITPLHVEFYNTSWQKIGTKWSLRKEISSITSISELDLIFFDPGRTSVAQKMSWAARRDTTRSEDIAYCLLGIFGIHMPLLYGEGRDAFRRLQEELLKVSSDQTIFAWMHPKWQKSLPWGMLACSPASFSDSGQITQSRTRSKAPSIVLHDAARPVNLHGPLSVNRKSYAMTNTGLRIELPIIEELSSTGVYIWRDRSSSLSALLDGIFESQAAGSKAQHVIAILDCFDGDNGTAMGIILTSCQGTSTPQRLIYDDLVEVDLKLVDKAQSMALLVSPDSTWPVPQRPRPLPEHKYAAWVFIHPAFSAKEFRLLKPDSAVHIREENGAFSLELTYDTAATLTFDLEDEQYIVYFGILFQSRTGPTSMVYCSITTAENFECSLGRCKKYLERHGEARSDQDGIWTDHPLSRQGAISISAINASRTRLELRDLVYVGYDKEIRTSLRHTTATASTMPQSKLEPEPTGNIGASSPSQTGLARPTPPRRHRPPRQPNIQGLRRAMGQL